MISFIYFDVGGVLNDDFSGSNNKWTELLKEIGIGGNKVDAFKSLLKKNESEICTTRDVDTLIPIFEDEFGITFPSKYSLKESILKRFYANPDIWPLIESLKQKIPIGLLTNMYPGMLDEIKQKNILPDVEWDVVIDSSVEQVTKPDKEIFVIAQHKAGVPNNKILFVDDRPENIEAAKAFGWHTFLYDSSNHKKSVDELGKFIIARI
jgi:FMN phosphatase YigB (HAD superfamily)